MFTLMHRIRIDTEPRRIFAFTHSVKAVIYCDIQSYECWKEKVENYDDDWDDDIYLYPDMDWYDLGYRRN